MDSNGSRYHALVTQADWLARVVPPQPDVEPQLAWDSSAGRLVLRPLLFEFRAPRAVVLNEPGPRAGGVFDAFGNLYALTPAGDAIRIRSSGSAAMSTFWPLPVPDGAVVEGLSRTPLPVIEGVFAPLAPDPASRAPLLDTLTVTTGHYAVAASIEAGGLLIFDLHGGGPPLRQPWLGMPTPEALIALADGGVGLLSAGRLHRLAPDLLPCVEAPSTPAAFAPTGAVPAPVVPPNTAPAWVIDLRPALGTGATVTACLQVAGDSLVVLGSRAGELTQRLGLIALDGTPLAVQGPTGQPLAALNTLIASMVVRPEGATRAPEVRLSARSLAIETRAKPAPDAPDFALVVLAAGGDQAFRLAARWANGALQLSLQRDYLPLRRYQGGGFASLGAGAVLHAYPSARAFYASEGRWVPLLALPQPRCERAAVLESPVWDSGLPGCVWHRLVLDASRPPGGTIRLQSRCADDAALLVKLPWRDEPPLLAHPRGSELPWRRREASACADLQSLTALLQDARGRWLQLRLLLGGDGQQSPGLADLRVWYPRFSYLREYLPAVYRLDDASASLLDRLLALFENEFTRWEDRIAAAQLLLDARSAPADTLAWLAQWVALAFDPSTGPLRRRLLLRHAMSGHARRGTVPGLLLAATLAWETDDADAAEVECWMLSPERLPERRHGLRLQELFGLTPPLAPAAWRLALGAADLLARLGGDASLRATEARLPVLQQALGFVPLGAQEEEARRVAWQLPELPDDDPVDSTERARYAAYLAASQVCAPLRQRWQDFLSRRWRQVSALNAAWGTRWRGFEQVPSATRLPASRVALADWHLFESQVLRGLGNAHRFRIVLPSPLANGGPLDVDEIGRRRAAVWRAIERDRPAHTVAELRFGFELFRVGEARLGLDTRLEHGLTRRPELAALGNALSLWPPMVLGQNDLGGAQLASARPQPPADRVGLDR